jgi:uncharacterized membrane protein
MQEHRDDLRSASLIRKQLVTIFLVFAIALQIAHYYPLVPDRVASHFDASGRPNGWSPRGVFFGFYVLTVVITLCIFEVSPHLLKRVPSSWISLPKREFWLSPERRERTLELIGSQMHMFGIATIMFMACTFQLAIQANLPDGRGFNVALMWTLLGVYVLVTIVWTARFIYGFLAGKESLR